MDLILLAASRMEPKARVATSWLVMSGIVAAHILQDTAIGKKHASDKLSGARRLRDAIVLGYQLQRAPGRDLGVPDWYSLAENEVGLRPALPNVVMNEKALLVES
ncbi:hypothetical protein BHE74_00044355 [Ensete ventricosum]|nr:hypothetical protein BHE74_00044355 [Ensete ventricosum]